MSSPVDVNDRVSRRLTQVGRALTYATSLDETLRLTVECAADLLQAAPVLLLLKDEEGALEVRAAHGVAEDRASRIGGPMDELLVERLRELLGPDAADRFIAVPLVVAGEVTGLLAAAHAAGADLDEAEWLLSTLADQASIALETSRHAEARTKLESQLDALSAAASANEQGLRIVSHDLRTPLSTIVAYVELLEAGMLGPLSERQLAALARIRESGRYLVSLLQNVLEMTRLSAGAVPLEPTAVELQTAVREAIAIAMMPRARAHPIEVAGEPVTAIADPVHVRQVLIHLIDNALKYTPPESRVRVSCSRSEQDGRQWAMILVEDDGPGIEPAKLTRIFEAFERVADPTTWSPHGTGLGLAIARGLVEKMGGRIDAESTPGRGTIFTISLPLAN